MPHPTLAVALCPSCYDAVSELERVAAAGGALKMADAPQSDAVEGEINGEIGNGIGGEIGGEIGEMDESEEALESTCAWCAGLNQEEGAELLGCESSGCERWFCESCVQRNLGVDEIHRVREASPWRCYACDRSPLTRRDPHSHHILLSHTPITYSHHIFLSHTPITYSYHILPSHTPITYSHHIFPSHIPITHSHHFSPHVTPAHS